MPGTRLATARRAAAWLALPLLLGLSGATPAQDGKPAEGVDVEKSRLLLVPASTVERQAAQQYAQLLHSAKQKGTLNRDAQQLERLRRIARDLIPHAGRFNAGTSKWRWEVNLISSRSVNAFCMPGGKIVFFTGILTELKLTDAEVAAVMGHEIAHALLEHGRARMSQQLLKNVGVSAAAIFFNLSNISATLLSEAAHLTLTLPYSRSQEVDSDLVGMELAARAGYDPRAAANVWRKMAAYAQRSGSGQPPQFLSTHPGHANRIREIETNLPRVLPLYEAAPNRPSSTAASGEAPSWHGPDAPGAARN